MLLKDGAALELTADKFIVNNGKVDITVPTIAATAVEQSIIYSVKLGAADAVAAAALVIAADAELAAQAAAETAVAAYEAAAINTYNDIASADTLNTAADTKVAAVTDVPAKTAFEGRVTAKETALNNIVAAKVTAVNDATNQIQLLAALAFFNGVDSALVVNYDAKFNGANVTAKSVQDGIYEVNLVDKMLLAITDIDGTNTVNQLKLQTAIEYGASVGVLTGVDITNYFNTYISVAEGYAAAADFDTIAEIQTSMIDAGLTAAVTNATNAVTAAETAALTTAKVTTAQGLIDILLADVAPATTKADLQTRLDVVKALLAVDGTSAADAATVLSTLQANATVLELEDTSALNAPYAEYYRTAVFAGAQATRDTAAELQALIAGVNTARATAATNAVTDAEAAALTAAKVTTAQGLIDVMPADVAPATTKADLQARLDVVKALLAVDGTSAADAATVLSTLQANATVLELEDASALNAPYAEYYKTAVFAGAQATRDTAAELQALIAGVNTARATAATNAVTDAEAAALTTAKVTTAQGLIDVMPADVAPATAKADLQARLDVVKALLAVDGASAEDAATLLGILQANATVLGLADTSAINPLLGAEYKAAIFAGAQATRDTAGELQALIAAANSPLTALDALRDAVPADADELLALLQVKTLNLTNLVVANKAQYLADLASIQGEITAVNSVIGDLDKVKTMIDASNAVAVLNAATTATAAKNALVDYALAVNATAYINLSTTVKTEVAELAMADIAANSNFDTIANIENGTNAGDLKSMIDAHAALLATINGAGPDGTNTIAGMDTALEALGYAAYDSLSAAQQLSAAEAFLTAWPLDGNGAQVNYTTLTAIRSAVDAAIAAIQ